MTITELNTFLERNCGITMDVIRNQTDENPLPIRSLFFKPYQSKADPIYRAATVITAPLAFTVAGVECALFSVLYAFKSIVDIATLDFASAKANLSGSLYFLTAMTTALCIAAISPLVNAIDLIGGGINTLFENHNEEENPASQAFPASLPLS